MDMRYRRPGRSGRPWRERTAEERADALAELRRRQQVQVALELRELRLLRRD